MGIKFNQHHVTDGTTKARVFYSLDNRTDGRACVTIYARDYDGALGKLFKGDVYKNDTDSQSDYFDQGRVVLFADHPDYVVARSRAAANMMIGDRKREERKAKAVARDAARRAA